MREGESRSKPTVKMAKSSGKAGRPHKTKLFAHLTMAVASVTEDYKDKFDLEALVFVFSSPLLGEARRCCTVFLHLALLTLTPD